MESEKIEVSRKLNLHEINRINFKICAIEPQEKRYHFIDKKMVDCTGKGCEHCATASALFRENQMSKEARMMWRKSRFYLPVEVDEEQGVSPGMYLWEFGKPIHDAYIQLITEADEYEFSMGSPWHELFFAHRPERVGGFPNFDQCFFYFGNRKFTIEKLRKDASSSRTKRNSKDTYVFEKV
jgi:hypothetical protein